MLQEFRKCLVRMFLSQDEDVLFFESARQLNQFPHMVLNCVPVPKETGDMAPIYFKVRYHLTISFIISGNYMILIISFILIYINYKHIHSIFKFESRLMLTKLQYFYYIQIFKTNFKNNHSKSLRISV